MDCIVHGVTKSWTQPSNFHFDFIFIAALFTIAKTLKQPTCPSTNEWIKKMWYACTKDYYSAMKRMK